MSSTAKDKTQETSHFAGELGGPAACQATTSRTAATFWWTVGAAVVLAGAHILRPSPGGDGALRPLGIPLPCLFKELTGVPCPACGLTRSVCETAHGRLAQAFSYHYLGPVVYLAAWIVLVWGLIAVAAGREGPGYWLGRPLVWRTLLGVFLGAWIVRLWAMQG